MHRTAALLFLQHRGMRHHAADAAARNTVYCLTEFTVSSPDGSVRKAPFHSMSVQIGGQDGTGGPGGEHPHAAALNARTAWRSDSRAEHAAASHRRDHVGHTRPRRCRHLHSTRAFTQRAGCSWQAGGQQKGQAYIPQPHTPGWKKHLQGTAVVSSTDAMEGASREKYFIYLDDAKGPGQGRAFSSCLN